MTSKHVRTAALCAAVTASTFANQTVRASLTFDLVATAVKKAGTTTVQPFADSKFVTASVGSIVRLKLYATVTGTDASKAQTLQSASGSLVSNSPASNVKGDFKTTRISLPNTSTTNTGTASHLSAPWTGQASSTGLAQDLDGDGDADLGSNNDAASDNFVAYRSNQLEGPKSNNSSGISDFGTLLPTTTGSSTRYVLSNQIDWVVTADGVTTGVNWRLRSGQSAVWFEDATETSNDVNGDGSVIQYTYSGGTTGSVQLVGAQVLIATRADPEPTAGALGLTALCTAAMHRRRRLRPHLASHATPPRIV